jgi:hypothetical protein
VLIVALLLCDASAWSHTRAASRRTAVRDTLACRASKAAAAAVQHCCCCCSPAQPVPQPTASLRGNTVPSFMLLLLLLVVLWCVLAGARPCCVCRLVDAVCMLTA